jgi:hypothetical protein
MSIIRKIHLLLGCFFAPAILFFVVSGAYQTFQLHADLKNGYQAPEILKKMGMAHAEQKLDRPRESSAPFKVFVALMSIGFIFTSLLGVVMAFRFFKPRWVVWVLLLVGVVLPLLLLV